MTRYITDFTGSIRLIAFCLFLQSGICREWNASAWYETSVKCTNERFVIYTGFDVVLKCQYGLSQAEIKSIEWRKLLLKNLEKPQTIQLFFYQNNTHLEPIKGDLVNRATYKFIDNQTLLTFPVKKSDSGGYQCNVVNDVQGSANTGLHDIKDPPSQAEFDTQMVIDKYEMENILTRISSPGFGNVTLKVSVKPQPNWLSPYCVPFLITWQLKDENGPGDITNKCKVTNYNQTSCALVIKELKLQLGMSYLLSVHVEQHGFRKTSHNFTFVYKDRATSQSSSVSPILIIVLVIIAVLLAIAVTLIIVVLFKLSILHRGSQNHGHYHTTEQQQSFLKGSEHQDVQLEKKGGSDISHAETEHAKGGSDISHAETEHAKGGSNISHAETEHAKESRDFGIPDPDNVYQNGNHTFQ